MKGVALTRAELSRLALDGLVITTDIRGVDGHILLAKGTVLNSGHRQALEGASWEVLHLVQLDGRDCHESEAGRRLARAVAGTGTMPGDATGGQFPVRAVVRGLLHVDVVTLEQLNLHPDFGVYTLFDGQVVDAEEVVARAKIIPFAVAETAIAAEEQVVATHGPPISVRAFRACQVSAVVQESLGDRAMQRFRDAFGEKVQWFGGSLHEPVYVGGQNELARQLDAALGREPDLLVVAGTRAMDPLDPIFGALESVRATMVRRGMPAHPGSLCWVARRGSTPIVGMPSCGVFSQATVFDLLLTWVFAGMPLTAQSLAQLGHGGFLTRDMAYRFPPYRRARERGAVE